MVKEAPKYHGIVMNRLITLRDRLQSYKTTAVEAQYLDDTIKLVYANLEAK